jgi:hypothetical protein
LFSLKGGLGIKDNEALFEASILAEEIIPIKIFIPSLLENLAKEKTDLVILYKP